MGAVETKIVAETLVAVQLRGIFCWRNNSGVARIDGRWVRFGSPGSPDIIGVLPGGRFLGIEVKTATGKESDRQREFRDNVWASGGVALVVHSPEETLTRLKEYLA